MKWYVIESGDAPRIIICMRTELEAKDYARYLNREYPDNFFYVRSEFDVEVNGNLL